MRTGFVGISHLGLVLSLSLLGPLGCSLSESSKSSSDSSESSSKSSSSSSPGNKDTAYRDDVRDYTTAYVKSGGQLTDFNKKIGDLAKARGITNWEDNMATYDGIGQGLGRAKVGTVELDAYAQNLGHGDPAKAQAIREGYAVAKQ
jgi:hypothetical protein